MLKCHFYIAKVPLEFSMSVVRNRMAYFIDAVYAVVAIVIGCCRECMPAPIVSQ